MTDTKPDRVVEHWTIVAVTALPPGWRNAFRIEGEDSHILYPCPAILPRSTVPPSMFGTS